MATSTTMILDDSNFSRKCLFFSSFAYFSLTSSHIIFHNVRHILMKIKLLSLFLSFEKTFLVVNIAASWWVMLFYWRQGWAKRWLCRDEPRICEISRKLIKNSSLVIFGREGKVHAGRFLENDMRNQLSIKINHQIFRG